MNITNLIQEREAAYWKMDSSDIELEAPMRRFIRETALLAYKAGLEAAKEHINALEIRADKYENEGIADIWRDIWEENLRVQLLKNIDQALSAIEKSV